MDKFDAICSNGYKPGSSPILSAPAEGQVAEPQLVETREANVAGGFGCQKLLWLIRHHREIVDEEIRRARGAHSDL
jgi:hypothetical protein